ncbi:hypothetical protein [Lysobacter solisilvae (ex Woo and Kim 2020)]|uniref:Uncharacterized protein n=1 Tax=Agrilutibacter terrestris TaxID=2865112 RepID=A0A7H0FWX1_9GAMM|nr:hypothetical protein [Lysobacter terrestris]QNP40537.1 hypothetical protein H8B22_13890 [Lysobacter terrestris]
MAALHGSRPRQEDIDLAGLCEEAFTSGELIRIRTPEELRKEPAPHPRRLLLDYSAAATGALKALL